MSAREAILASVRASLPQIDAALPDVPRFDEAPHPPLVAWFGDSLHRMGGTLLSQTDTDALAALRQRAAAAGVVCSNVPQIAGTRALTPDLTPASLADVELAVVRASFAVAETGSVGLTEDDLVVNALGYLAQHLVVLLDPADIVGNLHHAFSRPEYASARYTVLHTGPSATADIEGVLVRGAQGVRSLPVALVARP